MKDPTLYPKECGHHRWASNNSVFAEVGMDYSELARHSAVNGEPGYFWLENARAYGRMIDPPDQVDSEVVLGNPCLEMTLPNYALCNLVETFPANHSSYEEYERTLKFAYLYAKTITLLPTHNPRTNAVMLKERRIGTSRSGIIQAFKRHGRSTIRQWADKGYQYLRHLDTIYSQWLCIPKSIKLSTIKPSGSVALLAGATPGNHYPHSEDYFRVIRFASNSPMLPALKKAGYKCEEVDPAKEPNTTAVYFPIRENYFDRAKADGSMWEQMENAAMMQAYWADNAVSVSIPTKPEEAEHIAYALEVFAARGGGGL